ncbi:MAG: S41 family peptidase [Myxococcales bacterium]
MRRIVPVLAVCLILVACGGDSQSSYQQLANKCTTVSDQELFLRAWTDDLYLWYREVPAVDPGKYPDVLDYFAQLKTPATTASGKAKDQFHFTYPTAVWQALSQSGVEAGYGVTWALLARTPPRQAVAAYNQPGSVAATNNIVRGVQVLTVDDVDLVNANDQASVDKLNAGLFPATVGESHRFSVLDPGSTTPRTVTLVSANVTETPVQNVTPIDTPTGKVGYMLFNDHIATAEKALIDKINELKTAGVTDLVLDIRYNGGGYLAIASELAYMIAGSARTSGKTFERLTFNDKHPTVDPVTDQPLTPTPFLSTTQGLSVASGSLLPSLNLPRVFVLTGSGTCSASESILNGLAGVDVQVIQIGGTTCGKPYGFYPQDNCATTYFSIQFQGVNAKGFGDYADGFTPGATTPGSFAGCQVTDDFGHALGDPLEGRLAAALKYRANPTCTGLSANALVTGGLRGEGKVFKSPWRENRILLRPGSH